MRRGLRQSLPALSHHFGIRPWEIDLLTYGEIAVYLRALQELTKGE